MGTEIERKFLVSSDSWRSTCTKCSTPRQGYLAGKADDPAEVRVRLTEQAAYLTIKGGGGLVRAEFEYQIPSDDAGLIVENLCGSAIIDKKRYEVPYRSATWFVDEFLGRLQGLFLAEIELPNERAFVELPDWTGAEVTHDPRYRNKFLAFGE
jgi:adenylate cyclase